MRKWEKERKRRGMTTNIDGKRGAGRLEQCAGPNSLDVLEEPGESVDTGLHIQPPHVRHCEIDRCVLLRRNCLQHAQEELLERDLVVAFRRRLGLCQDVHLPADLRVARLISLSGCHRCIGMSGALRDTAALLRMTE